MKKSIAIAVALIFGICIATSAAVDVTRFGPKQYVRDKGKPQTVADTFTSYAGPGKVIVENGDASGDHRVSSAVITLNGQEIFSPHDFNPHVGLLEAQVDLQEANTLSVEVRSKPGSFLTVTVIQAVEPPTAGISADPDSIILGESAALDWTSTNADTVIIEPGIGTVDPIGSLTVSPEETTTYTITATNDGGQATASVTITVTNPIPTVQISADPATIAKGGSTTLTWTSISSPSASIDNGVGVVPLSGSVTVSPPHTTTYTITVSGPLGVASAQATVMVTAEIEPQPEGSFGEQYEDLIPPDSSVESYDARRFSVISGLVTDQGGTPIADVAVTILYHPEYGTAFTDGSGRYSIPVEGGAVMTVACEKEGLITAHRKVDVPWNDIAVVETMVMIPQDEKSTTVTFDGDPNTVVTHQSTEVSDEWGTRSCTTVFTGDNTAYLVDEEGNTLQELTAITTRATEFTTPDSMPAKLPPNSAYTYCVDLTVDGAERVRFDKPVITWVDNFLGFPVGEPVPVGYYDTARGEWVPSDSGVVVKLLDTDNDTIVDALDATGDNLPDDLNNDGSFSDEVEGLSNSQQYQPGATFWRFAVPHFYSKWDANWAWAFAPGAEAIFPNAPGVASCDGNKEGGKPCVTVENASFVEDRSRIVHEDIPIPGTDITLHYISNGTKGYHHVITVPASGDTVPASLKRIIVQLTVAGRSFEQILDPLPNKKAKFVWDGLDHLGKPVMATTTAHIEIGFVYDGVYQRTSRFGYNGEGMITGSSTREEVTLWKYSQLILHRGASAIVEGWTLSTHHFLSPTDPSILYKGDGTIIKKEAVVITTVAGNGIGGYGGDGGPATEAMFYEPHGVALDASGNLYIADDGNHRIRKVDTSGIITTVAGGGHPPDSLGDGGPATEADLKPWDVAVDASGNIYIANPVSGDHRIRKVDTDGIITTVAGNGTYGYSGDGGPATQAQLSYPHGASVDLAGNLYIADTYNHRVRRVDPSGIITTVAGSGPTDDYGGGGGYSGDGGPATQAQLSYPSGVAVDTQGNLYIADGGNHRIRRVDTSGIITTVAGSGPPGNYTGDYSGDGGPATAARLHGPVRVTVDAAGILYIADSGNHCIRKVDTSGIITTVAGIGTKKGYSGDGGPATEARLFQPLGVAVDPAGDLVIADAYNHRVRNVALPAAFAGIMTGEDILFADENGLGHIMASSGRHKQTIDLDTGKILYEFGYNEENQIISITDRFGNQITINRDVSGAPISITSPDGITTYLTIDGNNHLTAITYPDGSSYGFEYTPDGLLTAKIEPEGNRFEHTFSETGGITDATDEEGGHWQFSRQTYANGDILTEVLSAEGDKTSYLDHTYSTGAFTSTITGPTGAQTTYARSADGLVVNKNLPCGMEYAFKYGIDPEYGFQYVKGMWEDTPAGLGRVTLRNKTYQDTNADEVPDLITEQVTVNAKATNLVTDTLASTRTLTSPMGRTVTTAYDPDTLLTNSLSIPGLFDTGYGYDTKGRLTSIATNTRETSFTYNPQGFLETITDPEDYTTSYAYDEVGRMTGIFRPDGSSIGFDYDQNGNMTVLTTPSSIDHGFGYNHVNRNTSYLAPISGQYSYVYDRDRRLTQINFPSGLQINNIYSNGRLNQIQTPEGNIDFTYYCASMVESITKGTESIVYGYDGQLVTSETLNGTLNQTLGYTYNNDFNLMGFNYAGSTTSYNYDNDGLLTQAGAFTITRNIQNGFPEAVTGGALSLSRAFNGYGEVAGQDYTVNSTSLTSWSLVSDDVGRITQKQETVDEVTANYEYTYDPMGRLLTVTKDGALVEEYQYGPNGARISEVNILRGITTPKSYTYSDEDHLLTAGSTTYQYDADGFLVTKTEGTDVTQYFYSSRGELLQVILPDGKTIDYLHDPLGRRIAKLINGVIIEKYLWQGLTRLLAVYDGSDNFLMRFEYYDEGRMPIAMNSGGNTYYLTYDQVGSLRVVSDATGNVVKRVDYDSFGNIIGNSNPGFVVPFGFAGGLHDRDTGLARFGYRDYDPDIGRWTAKDPVLFAGLDTNLYGYCLNDPVNWTDPLGLEPPNRPWNDPFWKNPLGLEPFINVPTFDDNIEWPDLEYSDTTCEGRISDDEFERQLRQMGYYPGPVL